MTREEALAILAETEKDYEQTQRILRGLQILAKYDDDLGLSFGHDQMWVGDFEATAAVMSREEVTALAQWGWFEDYDSWSHY